MEPFYYNHMNKNQQAAYRAMQQGLTNLSDEFQIPRLEGKDLSNVFLNCGSITRRFSGLPALNINITQIPRT